MNAFEMNFDGLVGPTHNYGGWSYGNVASHIHSSFAEPPAEKLGLDPDVETLKLISA
jgi:succinylarginine dihydrolase